MAEGVVVLGKQPNPSKGQNPFSFKALSSLFYSYIGNCIKFFRGKKQSHSDIKLINSALFFVLIILTLYFILNVSNSVKKISKVEFKIKNAAAEAQILKFTSRLKDVHYYSDKVKLRDIFKMGAKVKDTVADVISSKAAEATKDLRLVGISWSEDPDAMVEDTKQQRTFFIKKGQMIGDVKVEDILKDRVVLRYGQELVELR
ncbi:MAG: hypothetical protein PHN57_08735 [Candidatus Omnitrophica bacterium]|nr:hypothetical protein [Candidatus Omnitrophota bacterium]